MYILGKEVVDILFAQVRGHVSCPSHILAEKPSCPLYEMSIQVCSMTKVISLLLYFLGVPSICSSSSTESKG